MTKVMNLSRMQSFIGGAAVAVCVALPLSANGRTFDDLYEKADKALYNSKTNDNTISYCKDE